MLPIFKKGSIRKLQKNNKYPYNALLILFLKQFDILPKSLYGFTEGKGTTTEAIKSCIELAVSCLDSVFLSLRRRLIVLIT